MKAPVINDFAAVIGIDWADKKHKVNAEHERVPWGMMFVKSQSEHKIINIVSFPVNRSRFTTGHCR